ncbi:capsid and scaffold protein [Pseudomonas phage TH15]|uniref:Capsid and scaffold protein n=1 Tax=Pseudomonas phage TH15 TaxID=2801839 RepID=A0A7T7Z7Z7_9CAUD|nr:capsid and scaffold protein [Pseudomonas phage TH15]
MRTKAKSDYDAAGMVLAATSYEDCVMSSIVYFQYITGTIQVPLEVEVEPASCKWSM